MKPIFRTTAWLLVGALCTSEVAAQQAPATGNTAPASRPSGPLSQTLTGDARSEYDAAVLLYTEGDFGGASLKFQRAYAISKDARLLWNAGAAEKQLRHYARTYLLVSRYLTEGNLSASERTEATDLLRTIESFVSHVKVNVVPDGCELLIDDVLVATLPTAEPLIADMGTRRFSVRKAGFKEAVLLREVVGGSPTTLEVRLDVDLREGTLRISAGADETIRIDGRPVGRSQWQGQLPAGTHALSVTGESRKPYQTDVLIEAGQVTTLRVSLEPMAEPQRGASEFVAWPWVAGGVALVALAGVGAYFAFAPDDPPPPAAAPGTISPGFWAF